MGFCLVFGMLVECGWNVGEMWEVYLKIMLFRQPKSGMYQISKPAICITQLRIRLSSITTGKSVVLYI